MILEGNFAQRKKGYPQGSLFFVSSLCNVGLAPLVVLCGLLVTVGCTTAPKTGEPVVLQGEAQGTTFGLFQKPLHLSE
jgi:hypothetical protein